MRWPAATAVGVKRLVTSTSWLPQTLAGQSMQRFIDYEDVAEVVEQGPTRGRVRLRNGLRWICG